MSSRVVTRHEDQVIVTAGTGTGATLQYNTTRARLQPVLSLSAPEAGAEMIDVALSAVSTRQQPAVLLLNLAGGGHF